MTNARKCRRVEPLLALAAGADLSPARSRVVEEHLRGCAACREAAEAFAATIHTLRELPALELSPEESAQLRRSVWERIEGERGGSNVAIRRSGPAWGTARWAAAAAVVGLALLLHWRGAREDRAPGPAAVPPSRAAIAPPRAGPPSSAAAERKPAPRIAGRRTPLRARPLPEPHATQPVRIELSTPDPDVRIVWLVGPAGDPLPPLSDESATSTDDTSTTKENPE